MSTSTDPVGSQVEVERPPNGSTSDDRDKVNAAVPSIPMPSPNLAEKLAKSSGRSDGDRQSGAPDSSHGAAKAEKKPSPEPSPRSDPMTEPQSGKDIPRAQLPNELKFLLEDVCNPDLSIDHVMKQGNIRPGKVGQSDAGLGDNVGQSEAELSLAKAQSGQNVTRKKEFGTLDNTDSCPVLRTCVGRFVFSVPAQAVVLLVIAFDCTLTILNLAGASLGPDEETIHMVGDYLVVVILSADVLGRLFFFGQVFFKSCMNIFELVLVPLTIIEIWVLRDTEIPLPLLRVIRPIFRVIRVLRVLVKTAGKTAEYRKMLRHRVSGSRKRFVEDGFDLDLAYITSQLIVMSVPGVGYESIFRNPMPDVARFLNERHSNKYLVVNLQEEQKYHVAPFFHRHIQFPIPKDSVPSLDALLNLCRLLDAYLNADPKHVIAIHSRNGQGRVGLIANSLLLYKQYFKMASVSVAFFEERRTRDDKRAVSTTQTLDTASQRRFLEYFAILCADGTPKSMPKARDAHIRRIRLIGMSDVTGVKFSFYNHPPERLIARPRPGVIYDALQKEIKDAKDRQSTLANQTTKVLDEENDISLEAEMEQEAVASISKGQLMDKVLAVVEECKFDSVAAGCKPSSGSPLFTTDHNVHCRLQETKGISIGKGGEPLVWEFVDTVVLGEICLEVTRNTSTPAGAKPDATSGKNESSGCCGRRKRSDMSGIHRNDNDGACVDGALFSAWLHTSFLENDQPPLQDMAHAMDDDRLVTVVFGRFDLDKCAKAPTLRSHSAMMKVQVEFQVDPHEKFTKKAKGVLKRREEDDGKVTQGAEFSESYSLGWLTWAVKRVWPFAERAVAKLLLDMVEPLLADTPVVGSIRFPVVSLGSASPELGPITSSAKDHEGYEVQFDIWVHYDGDANIIIDAGLASIGINHIKITGMLSVKLKPILPEIPIVAGVQLFFLNPPDLDLSFSGHLEVANFKMIRTAIFNAIHKAILDILVLPNMFVVNYSFETFENEDRVVTFQDVLPTAVLRLWVVQAKDLHGADFSLFDKPTSDPYCEVKLGTQRVTTSVIQKTINPVWNEDFDMLIHDAKQEIQMVIYDQDFTSSEVLGKIRKLTIPAVVEAGPQGLWMELEDTPQEGLRSRINLRAQVLDLHVDPERIQKYLGSSKQGDSLSQDLTTDKSGNAASTCLTGCVTTVNTCDVGGALNRFTKKDLGELDHATAREAVAVLVCQLIVGRIPVEVANPSQVDIKVGIGKSSNSKRCGEAYHAEMTTVGSKVQEIVERLALSGWEPNKIADIIKEDPGVVRRIMHKRLGWNLELLQRICVLVHPEDLQNSRHVDLVVVVKGKRVAAGTVALSSILGEEDSTYQEVVSAPVIGHAARKVDLDVELRLYCLHERDLAGGELKLEGLKKSKEDKTDTATLMGISSSGSGRPQGVQPQGDEEVGDDNVSLSIV